MVRRDFEKMWSAEKAINDDVCFTLSKGYDNVFSVDDIEIHGPDCDGLAVNMSFSCKTGGISCNFCIKGLGAIHRYCLGGPNHGNGGRYHQHNIQYASCVRRSLPHVVPRDEFKGLDTEDAWRRICVEANIKFTGLFFPPEVQCK